MNKMYYIITLLLFLPGLIKAETPGAQSAADELANQELARKGAAANRMIADYYNKIYDYISNGANYDDNLKFEKFSGAILPDGQKVGNFNAGIEFQINPKPQLYTPTKLGYALRVDAMQSLDPRIEANRTQPEGEASSIYQIVLKALMYRLLVEDRKKLSHAKYFDIKGIMDISIFNTCQLPVKTSRQAAYNPNDDAEAAISKLGQVQNGYYDFITYGSEAYDEYLNWLKTDESPLIDPENNQLKTLDFASYYNQFKRTPAEIREKFFTEVAEEEFNDAGEITFGIRYERYHASQPRSQLERPVQIFNHINLIDGSFGDGETDVDPNAIATKIREFINSEVYLNRNPPSVTRGESNQAVKFYLKPENTPEDQRSGYNKVQLKTLKPRILGFYCQTGASSIPNTPGAAKEYKEKVDAINSQISTLAQENPNHAQGLLAGKIDPEIKETCSDDGDYCNELLAEVRRASCFKSSYEGLKAFFDNEDNQEYFGEYFNFDTLEEKIEVVAGTIGADNAVNAFSGDLDPKAVKYYNGTADRNGQVKYLFCNEGSGVWGEGISGFSRRKDCTQNTQAQNIRAYLEEDSGIPQNVRTALENALEKVEKNPPESPASTDLEVLKNHFYRDDQFSRLGIIFSFEVNPDDMMEIQTSCADGIGIRFYGQEKDGSGSSTEVIDPNPFAGVPRLDQMPLGAVDGEPIPICKTLVNNENARGVAKNELRHCYRLKRNLGILKAEDQN